MENKHKNPLYEKAPIKIVTAWKEWRKAWDSTDQLEYLHSLLHFGFEIDIGIERGFEDHEDRILFYLAVAEGHADNEYLESAHPMRKLAIKAFKVLCNSYFKNVAARNITCSLSRTSLRELKIHGAILHFFRPVEGFGSNERMHLRNLPSLVGHNESLAADFLSELIRLCWSHEIGWYEPLMPDRTPLRKHRPRYVEILMGLDRLDMLLLRRAPNLDLLMDDESMDKLRELAVKPHVSVGGGVRMYPESVEHAASIGYKAAQTYLVLQAMRKEEQRRSDT